jgi:hypothetical protein
MAGAADLFGGAQTSRIFFQPLRAVAAANSAF